MNNRISYGGSISLDGFILIIISRIPIQEPKGKKASSERKIKSLRRKYLRE